MIGFEGVVDNRANEGWELGVLLAFASMRIDRGLCVRVFTTSIGNLSLIATAEVLEQCAGFFQSVVVGNLTNTAFEKLLLGWSVELGCLQDLGSTAACLLPSSLIGEFGSLGRGFLPITRVLDSLGFLLAFVNDTTVDTVFLLTIDNVATLAESTVDLGNRVVEGNLCHGLNGLKVSMFHALFGACFNILRSELCFDIILKVTFIRCEPNLFSSVNLMLMLYL